MERRLSATFRQGRCQSSSLLSGLRASRVSCVNLNSSGAAGEELAKPTNRIAQRISQGRAELLETGSTQPSARPLAYSQPIEHHLHQGNVEELSRLVELLPTDIQNTLREREDFHQVRQFCEQGEETHQSKPNSSAVHCLRNKASFGWFLPLPARGNHLGAVALNFCQISQPNLQS